MFRPELLRRDDPALVQASIRAYSVLLDTARASLGGNPSEEVLAVRATLGWSEAHGLATLWLDGNLPKYAELPELEALARKVFELEPVGGA
jgi:hypothetical protein